MMNMLSSTRYLAKLLAVVLAVLSCGCTSLDRELAFGRLDNAREMLRKGEGDVNQVADLVHFTPLMYASHEGAVDIVKTLIAKGARTDLVDVWGNRATHHACAAKGPPSLEITKILLDLGEPATVVNSRGYTLLHAALSQPHPAEKELVQLLLDRGVAVDTGTTSPKALTSIMDGEQQGHTPLMLAAKKGQTEIASMLLQRGADPNRQTVQGWTALHYAARFLDSGIASMLLDAGARPTRIEGSALALYLTGQVHLLDGLRHVARGDRVPAAERLGVAADSFAAAAPEFRSEAAGRATRLMLANAVMVAGAATQARIYAQQSAAMSPSGRGVGVASYQLAKVGPALSGAAAAEARVEDYATTSRSILQCVQAAADADSVKACLPR